MTLAKLKAKPSDIDALVTELRKSGSRSRLAYTVNATLRVARFKTSRCARVNESAS